MTARAAGTIAAVAGATALFGCVTAAPAEAPTGAVHVATSTDHPELTKTIPVAGRRGAQKRVVMTIGPDKLGDLARGDRLEVDSEVEVSTCLKHNRLDPGPGFPCVGRTYGYDPRIDAQIVLASDSSATGGDKTLPVSRNEGLSCKQKQPNRNHHCVIAIGGEGIDIGDTSALPCDPGSCHLNLVMSASHHGAKKGQKVVIGANARGGAIKQDKGRLDAVRLRPGDQARPAPLETRDPSHSHIPIVGHGKSPKQQVVYSIPLPNLREGEKLVVEGKLVAKLANPYSAFTTTDVILATGPNSADHGGLPHHVAGHGSEIGRSNAFNCTPGPSAFSNPCTARKFGVAEITHDSPKTLYLNLTTGMAVEFPPGRFHRGDRAKVLDRGMLSVTRYPPDSSPGP